MAIIDKENSKIIFDENELNAAWNNAPELTNLDKNEYRLCYLCKLRMDYELSLENTNSVNQELGWVVDLINAKKMDLSLTNLVAVHFGCLGLRKKRNQTRIFNDVKSLLWKYNE